MFLSNLGGDPCAADLAGKVSDEASMTVEKVLGAMFNDVTRDASSERRIRSFNERFDESGRGTKLLLARSADGRLSSGRYASDPLFADQKARERVVQRCDAAPRRPFLPTYIKSALSVVGI